MNVSFSGNYVIKTNSIQEADRVYRSLLSKFDEEPYLTLYKMQEGDEVGKGDWNKKPIPAVRCITGTDHRNRTERLMHRDHGDRATYERVVTDMYNSATIVDLTRGGSLDQVV